MQICQRKPSWFDDEAKNANAIELRRHLEGKKFACEGDADLASCSRRSKQGTFTAMSFRDASLLSYHRNLSGRNFESKDREIRDLCATRKKGRSPYYKEVSCACASFSNELSFDCTEKRDEGIPLAKLGSVDLDLRLGLDRLRRKTKRLSDQMFELFE